MIDSFHPKYTPNGYSIEQLRNNASKLKRAEGISHTEALDQVAREIKYSDWEELIGQKPNPQRDAFFDFMYKERLSETKPHLYRNYLDQYDLPDTKNSYRLFVLEHWNSLQELGIANLEFEYDPMTPEALLRELDSRLIQHGALALTPRRLEIHILESLIWAGDVIFDDIKQPRAEEYLNCIFICLFGIRAYQTKSLEIKFGMDELLDQVRDYHTMCHLELLSRRTKVDIMLPDIDDIFKPDSEIEIRFPA